MNRLGHALLLLVAMPYGCATHGSQTERIPPPPQPHRPAAPDMHDDAPPGRGSPGEMQPGSQIRIPLQVEAGLPLDGHVPGNSIVEAFGQRFATGPDGHFRLQAPAAAGEYRLLVHRPTHTAPFVLRITVLPPVGE
ncbi:hypothetical protein OK348_03790 [Flavobacterium sp. MXW15]|uniref:Carboxypeptidase regulatory-like domain-containing protein n=1 Tax=Xanthomonas chitinilytica TaxID=2989819 RepID=A0ABT3JRD6_9XANT|nr:hypothetical protein [Xanthomonas sp. H13-6]MCW4453913.1 hypothetical protein [Flavobacterium sp. MXW15]MCW4471041.1 hypothetical protein [Xanthomonas sp. H13-6]